jgi:peptidoglycan lytic transglycosylase G
MSKFLKIVFVFVVLGGGLFLFSHYELGPYGKGGNVYIPKGSNVNQITELLVQANILRNPWVFKALVRWKHAGAALKPGEYEFGSSIRPGAVLEKLVRGERIVHKLIIPEGYNFAQIAQSIEKAGIAKLPDILKYYRDPIFLQKLGFPVESLEGFLFPATYEYDRGTTLKDLLEQMTESFKKNFDKSLRERSLAMGWTIPQVVTLASIIEKETGQANERPLISSVFQNRLRLGMPLQSDPTVIFGLPNYDGNIHKADLLNPHPYNTYVHLGLPPGPIASPGKESLKAVLYPAQSDYLYFVAKGNGTHYFSKTLEEHEAAVAKYQLGKTESQPSLPLATPAPALH